MSESDDGGALLEMLAQDAMLETQPLAHPMASTPSTSTSTSALVDVAEVNNNHPQVGSSSDERVASSGLVSLTPLADGNSGNDASTSAGGAQGQVSTMLLDKTNVSSSSSSFAAAAAAAKRVIDREKISKLRINKRKIEQEEIDRRFGAARFIPVAEMVEQTLLSVGVKSSNEDWIAIAVVVRKAEPKKINKKVSENGKQINKNKKKRANMCCTVQLSNLKCPKSCQISLTLFDDAFYQFTNLISPGTILLLHKPMVNLGKDRSLMLHVKTREQVVILGESPDYGTCSKTNCENFVNIRQSHLCSYHQEVLYRECRSSRMLTNNTASVYTGSMFGGIDMSQGKRARAAEERKISNIGNTVSNKRIALPTIMSAEEMKQQVAKAGAEMFTSKVSAGMSRVASVVLNTDLRERAKHEAKKRDQNQNKDKLRSILLKNKGRINTESGPVTLVPTPAEEPSSSLAAILSGTQSKKSIEDDLLRKTTIHNQNKRKMLPSSSAENSKKSKNEAMELEKRRIVQEELEKKKQKQAKDAVKLRKLGVMGSFNANPATLDTVLVKETRKQLKKLEAHLQKSSRFNQLQTTTRTLLVELYNAMNE